MEFRERKRWIFLGLPWSFTVYHIKEDLLTVNTGFFTKVENDCYMYKIQDVVLSATLFERMVGVATVKCFTGDVTNPVQELVHIKNARAIKDFLLEASEKARIKRRTMNLLDIGTHGDTEIE